MSTFPGGGFLGMPGMGPTQEQVSRKFLTNNNHIVRRGAFLEKASLDVDHTNFTSYLRAGLVLAQVLTGPNSGKYVPFGHADCPDSADALAVGILMESVHMVNKLLVVEDKQVSLLIHGFVRESLLLWNGGDAGFKTAVKDLLPLVMFEADVPQP
jgi:hypothetical protein